MLVLGECLKVETLYKDPRFVQQVADENQFKRIYR
jgi:hypothetical protein